MKLCALNFDDWFCSWIIYICSDLYTCDWLFKIFQLQANLESELEVLEDLQITFGDMMENLGDADFVDG